MVLGFCTLENDFFCCICCKLLLSFNKSICQAENFSVVRLVNNASPPPPGPSRKQARAGKQIVAFQEHVTRFLYPVLVTRNRLSRTLLCPFSPPAYGEYKLDNKRELKCSLANTSFSLSRKRKTNKCFEFLPLRSAASAWRPRPPRPWASSWAASSAAGSPSSPRT